MKKWLLILALISLCKMRGQVNLVLNPSFEDTIQCAGAHSRFQGYVSAWRGGYGEYFNYYCQGWQVEVPANAFGFQYPRTGVAYAGIYCTVVNNITAHENLRDFIEAPLASRLTRGKEYCVSFYVSLADSVKYACPIGFAFTADSADSFSGYWTPSTQPIYMDTALQLLSDTSTWVLVSTKYTATGNERYITIGNFWNDTITPLRVVNPGASSQYSSCYFYIDDVSVVEYAQANAGAGVTICNKDSVKLYAHEKYGLVYSWSPGESLSDSTAIQPFAFPNQTTTFTLTITDTAGIYCLGNITDSVTIIVNDCSLPQEFFIPTLLRATDLINIPGLPNNSSLLIYDMSGRLILEELHYNNTLQAGDFAAGQYIYRLIFPDKTSQIGKIIIMK